MPANDNEHSIREAVGVFMGARALQDAIDALLSVGFDQADISLLASARTVDQKLGHKYQRVSELEDDPKAPRTCYVAPESIGEAEGALVGGLMYVGALAATGAIVASGGALGAAIIGAVLAAGCTGVIGGVLAAILGDQFAMHVENQLERGGLLLWVRTWTPEDEARAVSILSRHSGHDVHVHKMAA